ncbi:MAG: bifunctional phosphopantothenoylcysteine decarboxylase/phosphopantothenate--cysteine ligase CoaBC [Gammaproteobacteria bacterium]
MHTLQNKRVLLGVTGGIAAYKSADLVRRLGDHGADVRVVMTDGARSFITPLTFQAVSGNPVHTDLLDTEAEAGMGHIELARWADVILIAPATANFIARLTSGMADDLLTTLCLASSAPIVIVPAMNQQMWQAKATQANCNKLQKRGVVQLGPGVGDQACGDIGPGRMLEPAEIIAGVSDLFQSGELQGVNIMITAGPTQEALDPVRYITNHSSGKMGYAVAEAAVEAGANVTLISGPVNLPKPDAVKRIDVSSAEDMNKAVVDNVSGCQIFISAAAVADYTYSDPAAQKIKKSPDDNDEMILALSKTEDILANVANLPESPFTVGFAAETEKLEKHAKDKLIRKSLDMIAANRVDDPELGFHSDENALHVFWQGGDQKLERNSKHKLARELIKLIAHRFDQK